MDGLARRDKWFRAFTSNTAYLFRWQWAAAMPKSVYLTVQAHIQTCRVLRHIYANPENQIFSHLWDFQIARTNMIWVRNFNSAAVFLM